MAHLTVAASEGAFQKSFDVLVKNIAWEKQDAGEFGPFTAGYHVRGHLDGGAVELRDDNTIRVDELDIKWDQFEVSVGLDIPKICVGGGCVDFWLFEVCLPEVCIFEDDPDVEIILDVAPFVAQEVSFTGSVVARYFDASLPPPAIDPCGLLRDALADAGIIPPLPAGNQWHIHIDPESIDIDLFDFSDVAGDLFEDALTAAIEGLIPGDGWARDLILEIIGGAADLIRSVLDIPDDIDEWLSDLFNVSFGLVDFLLTLVLDFFGHCVPIYRIDDPFEVLPAEVSTSVLSSGAPVDLVPVAVPIRDLEVAVNDHEMVIQADIGA